MVVSFASVIFCRGVGGQRPWVTAIALSKMTVSSGKSLSAYTATWLLLKVEVEGEMPSIYDGDVGSR